MKQNEPLCNRLAGSFGSAFSGGKLKIYDGVMPDPDDIISNNLLCEITLPSPAFGVIPANQQVLKTGTWQGTVIANGTATWAKLQNAAGTHFAFLTVGLAASEIILSAVVLAIADTVTIDSGTYTVPTE